MTKLITNFKKKQKQNDENRGIKRFIQTCMSNIIVRTEVFMTMLVH